MSKKIILAIVLIGVVGSITYLELQKPHPSASISILQSAENQIATGATTTPAMASGTQPIATNASGTVAAMGQSTVTAPANPAAQAALLKARAAIIQKKSTEYIAAPELTDPSGFINTPPFKLSGLLENKVVLLDFWTYSCINCVRTIPYLNAWYQKYKDYGLVIVGVHTPEFDFEHNYANVAAAVKKDNIQYPVVLDNDQGTWTAYQNLYWPHEYVIDIDGFIVHDHIGEGDYATTEASIQAALQERSQALGLNLTIPTGTVNPENVISVNAVDVQSPETYFGANRNSLLANGTPLVNGTQTLTTPSTYQPNALYLGGSWDFEDEYAQNQNAGATITYTYEAKNVYMVASANKPVTAQVLLDGKPLGSAAGSDISANSTVTIQANRLYNIVSGSSYGQHTLEFIIQNPGLQAYTFTFG